MISMVVVDDDADEKANVVMAVAVLGVVDDAVDCDDDDVDDEQVAVCPRWSEFESRSYCCCDASDRCAKMSVVRLSMSRTAPTIASLQSMAALSMVQRDYKRRKIVNFKRLYYLKF